MPFPPGNLLPIYHGLKIVSVVHPNSNYMRSIKVSLATGFLIILLTFTKLSIAQRAIWSEDSLMLTGPGYGLDRYHEVLRFHDPSMYLVFPIVHPTTERSVPLQDVLLGLKELFHWRRAAIVTDSESIIRFTHIFSVFAPGIYKGFLPNEFDQAVTWVSAPKS